MAMLKNKNMLFNLTCQHVRYIQTKTIKRFALILLLYTAIRVSNLQLPFLLFGYLQMCAQLFCLIHQ